MRFAVHGPGYPVASPRSHGVPRRDVPGRVHVSVASKTAGRAHEARLALARLRVRVPARRATLAREMRLDLLHSSWSLFLQAANQQSPTDRRISRFSPAFWRTFRPGSSHVPFAARVMFLIQRSSTLIRSKRRAMSVLAFSAQSWRRSVSRALSRAMASFVCARRLEPRSARASFRSRRRMRCCSRVVKRGACSSSPVDRAALTATPRRSRPPGRYAWRESARRPRERRHASAQRGPSSPGDSPPVAPGGTSGTAPSRPLHPNFAHMAGQAVHIPSPPASPHDPESLMPPGLTPRRPPSRAPRTKKAAIACAKSRTACCCTIWEPAASQGYPARATVS